MARRNQYPEARKYKGDPKYRAWQARLKYKWGLTEQEYIEKLANQNFECAICEKELTIHSGRDICLDHCHETGVIRDFLCSKCNRGLGDFSESIKNLEAATLYLEKYLDLCTH